MNNFHGTPNHYPRPSMHPKPKRALWPWLAGGVALVGLLVVAVSFAAITVGSKHRGNGSPARADDVPTKSLDQYGFKPLAIGEEASWSPRGDGDPIVRFSITKISLNPECSTHPRRPSDRQTILLDVSVQTLDFPDSFSSTLIAGTINPLRFQTRDAAGATHSGTVGMCVSDSKAMPMVYAPNSHYVGQIEIEAENSTGKLLLVRNSSDGSGWAWSY